MSADREQMAKVLEGEHRLPTLLAVTKLIEPSVSSILDIGCGNGALIPLMARRAPFARIVGLDRSLYLLTKLRIKRMGPRVTLVLGEVPRFPFRPSCFDTVVSVQFLHEVFHFMGEEALMTTIELVYNLLDDGGSFIVLDHQNPGTEPIEAHLTRETLEHLLCFEKRFQPRAIAFEMVDDYCIRIPMRDFYDFITKLWALETPLEEEEMKESHTSFTAEEFAGLAESVGFRTRRIDNLTPIESHLQRHGISIISATELPGRHFLLQTEKTP